jgi:polyisoprenoid-binding protein YceI
MTDVQPSKPEPDLATASVPSGTYVADAGESGLRFKAKAFTLFWVRGHIPAKAGTLRIVDGRLSGTGEIAADRIATGVRARDWHLRSAHYLHTNQHPTITLSVQDADISAGEVACTVTVRGTSSVVPLRISSVDYREGRLHLAAGVDLDRTVFPMLPPIAGVSRRVHIDLSVVAHPA